MIVGRSARSAARADLVLRVLLAVLVLCTTGGVSPGAWADVPARVSRHLRVPFPREDGSLTPYTFELGYPLMTLVYDTLLWRDADGTPEPWLARSTETSHDGRRVTIHLTDGVRWHDDVPLTAADVVFTFGFAAERADSRFAPELRSVEGVSAPDPTTVVITLRHPSPGFADQPLADLPILPAHLWQGPPTDRLAPAGLPVGSGPYRLVEHRPGELYRFTANAGYFRGPPAVDALDVPIMSDAEEVVQAFENGQIDMIPFSLPPDAVSQVDNLGARLAEGPSYLGTALLFNVRKAPFDRLEVRQAISRALDLGRMADLVGDAVSADKGYLHPDSPWASTAVLHSFDAASARAALAGMNLPPLRILAPEEDTTKLKAGLQVALALERAGVKAEAASMPRASFARSLGQGGATPSFDLAIGATPSLASYDPDLLGRIFASDQETGSLNSTGYRSPRLDELAERVESTPNRPVRRAVVMEMLQYLADEVPAVPLFFANGAFVYRPGAFDGWVYVKGSGILDKQSLLSLPPSPAAAPGAPEPVDDGAFPYGVAALAVLVAAAAVVVGGGLRGRD